MLKFVLTQMTHSYAKPQKLEDTFIVITIKNITWGRSNKFQGTILNST